MFASLIPQDDVFFRKEEWEITAQRIAGIPGTWCDMRGDYTIIKAPETWIALWCCPNCATISAVDNRVHDVSSIGHVQPKKRLGIEGTELCCTGCSFLRRVYFDRWNDKPLYAVAFERREYIEGKEMYIPQVRYCHATTQREAITQLALRHSDRIIGIAPVIGAHVLDKHGEILQA